jgi:outer membrane protein OmpA-like peptidoglycan-associated protein
LLLQQLGALLASRPQLKISVTGHADARGAAGYNFELSTARAAAVAEALSDGGARREQMWVEGLGASRAAALVDDADGLALERRVEIRIGFDSAALAQRGAP